MSENDDLLRVNHVQVGFDPASDDGWLDGWISKPLFSPLLNT